MAKVSRNTHKVWAHRLLAGTAVFTVTWLFSGKLFLHVRPDNVENICAIFDDRYSWYKAATASEERWGTPKHVQMAIVRQESSFIFNARPPRTKLMGFIPWKRPTDAYGFAQALDNTWQWYLDDTKREVANRDEFADAIDFVGWYTHKSNRMAAYRSGTLTTSTSPITKARAAGRVRPTRARPGSRKRRSRSTGAPATGGFSCRAARKTSTAAGGC